MTKYDQISSGVSHRPITEGMGESSSRNYVFFYLYILRKKIEFFYFCDVRRKGWGYAHIWEMGVYMALYGDAATPRGFWVD
jgi:hypothetical protein